MPDFTLPDGVRLSYDLRGEGPAMVLLHGLGSRGSDWVDHYPVLEGRRRLVVPDLRGCGESDKPEGPYPVAQHAADVVALLDGLGIEQADVIGYSMGGAVAFQIAVEHPTRVRSLMVVNSSPTFSLDSFKMKAELVVRKTIIKLFGVERLAGLIAKRLFPKPDQQPLRDRAIHSIQRNTKEAYIGALEGLAGWSVEDRIADLKLPVLVVAGDNDYTPVEFKRAYTAKIEGARLVVVEDSRHGMPLEKVEEFNEILDGWLGEIPQA